MDKKNILSMPAYSVILIEPKHQRNVGFTARAMKNFGLKKLYLAGKFKPTKEAFSCAAHAKEVLKNAEKLNLKEAAKKFDFLVGTTSVKASRESSVRTPLTPRDFARKMKEVKGEVALVFGREDIGMLNEELELCDLVITIPANKKYPVLNISHAAGIIFYELFREKEKKNERSEKAKRAAKREEKEALLERLSLLLKTIKYPKFKKEVALRIFKRVAARSGISGREAHTLAGIFKEANDMVYRAKRKKKISERKEQKED